MSECTGPEPQETQPQEAEAPQEEPKNSGSGASGLIMFLVVAMAGAQPCITSSSKSPRQIPRAATI